MAGENKIQEHAVDATREVVREWAESGLSGSEDAWRKLSVLAGLADTTVVDLLYQYQCRILRELRVIEADAAERRAAVGS